MSAKIYNLDDYKPDDVFMGLIGLAYENGHITKDQAIELSNNDRLMIGNALFRRKAEKDD